MKTCENCDRPKVTGCSWHYAEECGPGRNRWMSVSDLSPEQKDKASDIMGRFKGNFAEEFGGFGKS